MTRVLEILGISFIGCLVSYGAIVSFAWVLHKTLPSWKNFPFCERTGGY